MARIRSIKPDFFLDEGLAELPAMARLLFIGLWTLADREGRLEDRPKRIKASVFPYDDTDVELLLEQLWSAGFIVRYEVDGVACISVPGFAKHQRPHPKETSYNLPPCPSTASREVSRQGVEASRRVPVVVGCGNGDGDGCGDGDTASQESAAVAPPPSAPGDAQKLRPTLVLQPTPADSPPSAPEKKPREHSKAERLYAKLEQQREKASVAAGLPFVPEGWHPARINRELGPVAKGTDDELDRFADAWDEYLAASENATRDPPYSLGYFIASRSTWESRALRKAGGAP